MVRRELSYVESRTSRAFLTHRERAGRRRLNRTHNFPARVHKYGKFHVLKTCRSLRLLNDSATTTKRSHRSVPKRTDFGTSTRRRVFFVGLFRQRLRLRVIVTSPQPPYRLVQPTVSQPPPHV